MDNREKALFILALTALEGVLTHLEEAKDVGIVPRCFSLRMELEEHLGEITDLKAKLRGDN